MTVRSSKQLQRKLGGIYVLRQAGAAGNISRVTVIKEDNQLERQAFPRLGVHCSVNSNTLRGCDLTGLHWKRLHEQIYDAKGEISTSFVSPQVRRACCLRFQG